MLNNPQTPLCPECGAEIEPLSEGRDLALPVDVKPKKPGKRAIFTGGAPCPYCSQSSAVPEWARTLRPGRREGKLWRFTYSGIL
jgi:hypothetical protein